MIDQKAIFLDSHPCHRQISWFGHMEVLILEKRYHDEHEKFLEKMLFFEKKVLKTPTMNEWNSKVNNVVT